MRIEVEHGVRDTFHDNLGGGWRMECLCGFMTAPSPLQWVGEEMDDHFKENASDVEPK